jgi:hypothetical protein
MGGETKGNETKAIKWQWFSPPYMGPRYENKIKEKIKSLMAVKVALTIGAVTTAAMAIVASANFNSDHPKYVLMERKDGWISWQHNIR